ncbi:MULTISPECIES: glycosyltransferase family 1 protein [unclassified Bradyrhizobium]|uniref:glycosyltransferase family 4 protein n=1 Tax=unclassified Bradyrhizobium TaxID=2631580 RepID=UPI0028EC8AE0|nr:MULTISPECIES: glycosyltransferase family 1 protein [unclassified Bradyrhizobium]
MIGQSSGKRPTRVIGLDVITDPKWMGGIIYIRNLVYCLESLPEAERPEVRLLGVPDDAMPLAVELRSFPFVDRDRRPRRHGAIAHFWRRVHRKFLQTYIPPDPAWQKLDATYPTIGGKVQGVPAIRWIPDFQHVHLPHFFTEDERDARDRGIALIASEPGVLVLSSEMAKRDFLNLCPNPEVEPHVWRFCSVITDHERGGRNPHTQYRLPRRYAYIANQFWAHKNHRVAFEALRRLKARHPDLVLVCTGREDDYRDKEYVPELLEFIAKSELQDRILRLGLVPRADQIEIFRHATLVLQPSLFEGWSTVVEDAKTLGRPIIASDIPVHREQLEGEKGLPVRFFPPDDDAILAETLSSAWRELPDGPDPASERRAQERNLRQRLAAARSFVDLVERAIAIEGKAGVTRGKPAITA